MPRFSKAMPMGDWSPCRAACLPSAQVRAKGAVDRLVGPQQVVIDLHAGRLRTQVRAEALEVFQVLPSHQAGIDGTAIGALQAVELREPIERKLDLLAGQDVQQQDLVACV